MIRRPNSKANRDQILAAFDALNAEYKKLEASGGKPGGEPSLPLKETVVAAGKAAVDVGGEQSIDGVIAGLAAIRSGFGNAVSGLSAKLTAEASRLEVLRSEIGEISKQLGDLHGISSVADNTLLTVVKTYDQEAEGFKKSLVEKQQSFEVEMTEKNRGWHTEQEEHGRAIAERDDLLKKAQERGAAEYEYDLAQRRKADQDGYEQQRKALQQALDEGVQAKQKQWAEKEKTVADAEKLYAEYKAKHEALPTQLADAIKKAKGEGAGIANGQSKIKADLLAKELDGEKRVFELKIKSLETSIKERSHQIEQLSAQLSAALKQGQDLAVKAIEGASTASSFVAVKEIALEQAKNTSKSK